MKKNIISLAHSILNTGVINQCSTHQQKENSVCSCCTKNTFIKSNSEQVIIDLLDNELDILQEGYMGHLQVAEDGKSVACTRHLYGEHVNCTNKPLDCKLYPLLPVDVEYIGDEEYRIKIIGCAPKCPLMTDESYFSESSHIRNICATAILLYQQNCMTEMMGISKGDGYKGYNKLFEVRYNLFTNYYEMIK